MPKLEISSIQTDNDVFVVNAVESLIVQSIRAKGPLSRTDLTQLLNYSRASLTTIVGTMVETGILHEVGEGRSAGGRRPLLLDINPQLGYVAGVDIGATSVDYALADFQGKIFERYSESCDVRMEPELFLNNVCDVVSKMLAKHEIAPERLVAIGLGVPGPVEFAAGVLIAPPLMPSWEGYPIKSFFRPKFPNAKVVVDNDVNIMAKGEQKAGNGQGVENFLFVKIGTGIGCGIISNGRIYRGNDGCAGDIGHICVDYNGPICHCGNQGCLEYLAAGPAIAAQGIEKAQAGQSPFLAQRMQENDGELTAADVGEAAAAGDRAANEIIRTTGRMIGGVLAGLVNFYNPKAIFIGGGVSKIGYTLLSTIRQATLRRATALSTRRLQVEYSQLGDDTGVVGAIWLALENVFIVQN
ncbi:ROK family protein [Candidatus Leptofilum sp.]|uniref:ROK family protein n=1 Tax=Candidatus Leptofilum sp. TaxID=3241576 RepID=UPI003B5C793B